MAESRIVKVRLNEEYLKKLEMVLAKYQIDRMEHGAESMALRICIDIALPHVLAIPKDTIDYNYKTVSKAFDTLGKKRKRKPKRAAFDYKQEWVDLEKEEL
ncbi:MAG: hypothetical protein CL811_12360 [Colwelliaceae bacterium]|jgi:hypothetical protein|nr:hypothetical protein [Colwelliaceae bacterium]|tara:strand:+ start:562 stop:864 length:303 start_codon:yes stop_codon:yes gene_type:complete